MIESIIEVTDVCLARGEQMILSDISLTFEKGVTTVITGSSGSGKSTLLKLIASIQKQDMGTIMYDAQNIYDYDMPTYRQLVSYCTQNPQLFGETVRDNLAFPYDIRQKALDETRAHELLTLVGLGRVHLDQPVKQLSGGEKQRIALIRNILIVPKVLLLDEITSSLDEDNRSNIMEAIESLKHQEALTIIMVSHNERDIQHADRIIKLEKGKVVEDYATSVID